MTSLPVQAKVVEAEKKYKGIREQLEAITVRVQQLEPQSAELKNEAQSRSKAFNTAQVREQWWVLLYPRIPQSFLNTRGLASDWDEA